MSHLLIAEKPSQAERLSIPFGGKKQKDCFVIPPCDTFPNGAKTVWCVGHIMELASAKEYAEEYANWKLEHLPIIPPGDRFKLKVVSDKKSVFQNIKSHIQDSETKTIVNCGDPAREGQLLVDEVINIANTKKKPVLRVWTTSLTAGAVKKAFANLKDNSHYFPLYQEALARQHSDWLVGINMSRCASILMQMKGVDRSQGAFSVGRIQTPLVSIVYDREIEIENFTSHPYWDVYAEFSVNGNTYRGKWFKEGAEHIYFSQQADALMDTIRNKSAYVLSVESERKEYKAPKFYNLSALQEDANKRFKYSPKETLEIAQALYERGYISYPRSQPTVVTEEEAKGFPGILQKLAAIPLYQSVLPAPKETIIDNKRYVDNAGVDDHHAIIVTEQIPDLATLSQAESNIYDMIARRLIAAHYEEAVFDLSNVITVADNNFTFLSKGKILINEGWRKIIFPSAEDQEQENEEENISLPPLEIGESGVVRTVETKEGKTQPKPRFTLGTLISVMKNAGNTIESTNKEGYKNSDFALGTEATRAGIIEHIQKQKYIMVERNQVFLSSKGRMLIEGLKQSDGTLTSPLMTAQWENYLYKIGKGKGTYKVFIENTKSMTKKYIEQTIEEADTWDFTAAIEETNQQNTVGNCKECGSPMIERKEFYGCSAYQTSKCGFTFPKVINGKKMPINEVRKFFNEGTTSLIKGFISRKNSPFDAFIIWDEMDKKRKFSFPERPKTKKM